MDMSWGLIRRGLGWLFLGPAFLIILKWYKVLFWHVGGKMQHACACHLLAFQLYLCPFWDMVTSTMFSNLKSRPNPLWQPSKIHIHFRGIYILISCFAWLLVMRLPRLAMLRTFCTHCHKIIVSFTLRYCSYYVLRPLNFLFFRAIGFWLALY